MIRTWLSIGIVNWLLFAITALPSENMRANDYCIVGGGPSGLQFAYFLHKANRDYVVFERNSVPGSFFVKYPRHRKLISINKRYTGRHNKEFNLRHDWNSLISDNENLLFTKYSKDYFPHADDYLKYMADFQRVHNLNVNFNTEVSNINKSDTDDCKYTAQDQHGNKICCRNVQASMRDKNCRISLIIANGVDDPIKSDGIGHELIEGYEDMNIDPSTYDGDSILLFGCGNSGMEVASSLYGHAASVHLAGRTRVRFSWDTHYVGDIRTDGKIDLRPDNDSMISIDNKDNYPARHGYTRIIRCIGFAWNLSLFAEEIRPALILRKYPKIKENYEAYELDDVYFVGPLAHSLDWRKSAGGFIHGFRYTARTLHHLLEWKHHGMPWPHRTGRINGLASAFLNRANEGSGIYQMFTHLGDFAIYDRQTHNYTYLEEFPINLWLNLTASTGHEYDPERHLLFTMTLEYGAKFSIPGADHFGSDRIGGSDEDSNFLHPVVRVFRGITTTKANPKRSLPTIINTKPLGLIHVPEDFTTEFAAIRNHIRPLRRFFEFYAEIDLRVHARERCALDLLTNHAYDPYNENQMHLPEICKDYLNAEESVSLFLS